MKRTLFGVLVWATFLTLASCNNESPEPQPDADRDYSRLDLTRADIELSAEESEVAQAMYEFPTKFLEAAYNSDNSGHKSNTVVSPLSCSMLLGMITNALDEEAREELYECLGIKAEDLETLNSYHSIILRELPSIDPSALCMIANGFWLRESGTLSDCYRSVLQDSYNADLGSFRVFTHEVKDEINGWIKERTDGAIDDLLKDEDVNSLINVVWTDALHFNGVWRQGFDASATRKAAFYPSYPDMSGRREVRMMTGADMGYLYQFSAKGDTGDIKDYISAVTLPYGNESFMLTAVLPAENDPDINATLRSLTPEFWKRIDNAMTRPAQEINMELSFPVISADSEFELIPVMKRMGVNRIFTDAPMVNSLDFGEELINIMRQRVIFDLDEEGARIKAASLGIGMDTAPGDIRKKEINFNRPFIYFVRERSTGAVLLAGIMMNPGL